MPVGMARRSELQCDPPAPEVSVRPIRSPERGPLWDMTASSKLADPTQPDCVALCCA